jgi:hypothetical protein
MAKWRCPMSHKSTDHFAWGSFPENLECFTVTGGAGIKETFILTSTKCVMLYFCSVRYLYITPLN